MTSHSSTVMPLWFARDIPQVGENVKSINASESTICVYQHLGIIYNAIHIYFRIQLHVPNAG